MNLKLACRIVEKLLEIGVTEVCLCAGGRNSPLVVTLRECPQLKVWHFFEERSAAFFALGRSWSRQREPVAIVTTSGTAAGELLPAMMEAHYAGVPLVAVTADRPRSFRGSGAPQTAEQVGLFFHYAKQSFDIASVDEASSIELAGRAPIHINVCFSEPLLDGPVDLNFSTPKKFAENHSAADIEALKEALASIRKPLVILSHLPNDSLISDLIEKGNCLIYAEGASQRRRSSRHLLRGGAEKISKLARDGAFDGIIRVGGVPTLRFWRDLEDRFRALPVVSLCSPIFSGLARASTTFSYHDSHLRTLLAHLKECDSSSLEKALAQDARDFARLDGLLKQHPRSEPGWMRWLSEKIPPGARVFLGNSLPVREWDLSASYADKQFTIHSSRGLNGIDGQLSTFFGWASRDQPNVGIFGDLTALYDLSAPWILRQLPDVEIKLIVINNHGGQIFERMFRDPWFINAHDLRFEHWAKFWNLEYARDDAMLECTSRRQVVEIRPDPESTRAFWREYEA